MKSYEQEEFKQILNAALTSSNLTLTKAVEKMNESYPEDASTVQNISGKITRGTLRFIEAKRLLEMCGFEIRIVPVSEEVQSEPAEQYAIDEHTIARIKGHPTLSYVDACQYGITSIQSSQFQTVMIAGQKCNEAADFYKRNMSKYPDMNASTESYLLYQMQTKYDVVAKPLLKSYIFE